MFNMLNHKDFYLRALTNACLEYQIHATFLDLTVHPLLIVLHLRT